MAISRSDCLLLLADLKEQGINTSEQTIALFKSNDLPISVIEFINSKRTLDLTKFYTKIRKSYNSKNSNLYINIVKEDIKDPKTVLTTLSALQTQIFLFLKNCENEEMFIRHSRIADITKVLYTYSQTFDLVPCIKLLQVIKADLKCCEAFEKNVKAS